MDFSFDASIVSAGSDARIKAGEKYIFVCVQAELKQTRAGDEYINGLRFARDLIVKRMEAGK